MEEYKIGEEVEVTKDFPACSIGDIIKVYRIYRKDNFGLYEFTTSSGDYFSLKDTSFKKYNKKRRSVKVYIQPRQTGKTNTIIKLYQNCDNGIIICANNQMKYMIGTTIGLSKSEIDKQPIYTIDQFYNKTKGLDMKNSTILIDEYFFFSNTEKDCVYKDILSKHDLFNEIIIFSTSNKIYNKDEIKLIKDLKKIDVNQLYKFMDLKEKIYHKFNDLYVNVLTDPDCEVIEWQRDYDCLSEPQRKTQMEGRIF